MTNADTKVDPGQAFAADKAKGGFEVLDRKVGLTRRQPEPSAPNPAKRKARVESERRSTDAMAESMSAPEDAECICVVSKGIWIVVVNSESASSSVDTVAANRFKSLVQPFK